MRRAPCRVTRVPGGKQGGKATASRIAWETVQASKMSVRPLFDGLEIVISGPAAKIPALKNSKLQGTNFTNPAHLGRIHALDALFRAAAESARFRAPFSPETPVYMIAFIGARPQLYDADNCFTTLKDWLEPATKPVGRNRRGWGIGLVENDRFVSGFALAARDIGSENPNTLISIRKLDSVKEHLEGLLRDLTSFEITMTGKGGFSEC